MNSPIQSVEVSYLVHATEDQAKIQRGVESMVGSSEEPQFESLDGHFGNKIVRASLRLTGDAALRAFESVISKMQPETMQRLLADLGPYLDEHSSMFLRFDKQALVGGSLVLGSGDTVRLKVKPRGYLKGGASSFFRGLIQGRKDA